MELSKIEKLLQRYEEGETSLAEERLLSDYFTKEQVPEYLEHYKLLFTYTKREQQHQYDDNVKENIKTGNYRFAWTSIAAVIIVALGMFYFNQPSNSLNQNDLGTISDQEVALQKTKETLNMVSRFMNEGSADLVYLQEFNKTTNKIIEIN